MFIVWGTSIRRRPRGQVPHFCPVCRELRLCALNGVHSVRHIYFIPLERGRHLVDERTCPECKSVYGVQPGLTPDFPPVANAQAGIDLLPDRQAAPVRERIALEAQLKMRGVSPELRANLIAEPFAALEFEHTQRNGSHWTVGFFGFLLIVSGITALLTTFSYEGGRAPEMLPWAVGSGGVALLSLVMLIWAAIGSKRRMVTARMVPRLARSLHALDPKPAELRHVLASLASAGCTLARHTDQSDLLLAIDRLPRNLAKRAAA